MTSMWDDSIRGWNATTGKEEFQLCGHNRGEGICCIAAHPTCPVLASSSYQTLILWDLSKQELTFRFDIPVGHVVEGLAWHPDGERLYVVDEGKLTLLSHATKSELHRFDAQRHSLKVVAVSPDGAFVAAAGGGGFVPGYANRVVSSPKKKNCVIHVWNTETLEEINQLSGHTDIVRRLAFTGDGKQLLSIASDRKLRLWDIK